MIGLDGTFPLNGGRGRATLQCTWSIHRIDAQLGRLLGINSAWRDPREQEKLYTAYRNYVNGNGPWAPIALPPEQSVHCKGEAIDTDDNNAAMTRILNENGWYHTVYRNGQLVEPWHYEYFPAKDKHFGGSAAGSGQETDFDMYDNDPALRQRLDQIVQFMADNFNGLAGVVARHGQILEAMDIRTGNETKGNLAIAAKRIADINSRMNYAKRPNGDPHLIAVQGDIDTILNRLNSLEAKLPKA